MTAASRPARPTCRPADHRRRRAEADRHRLFRRDDEGPGGSRRGARQRDRLHRRADRSQYRRADHLHRQLHHAGRERHSVRRQRPGRHRAGAEEGARRRHPCRRLRRQLPAGRARMVRQPGRVQRHRQVDDRRHGGGDRRGRRLRHRHLDLHHAEPGALDRRDAGLPGRLPPEHEVAGDGRGAGGQHAVLQPGLDAHQQIWRRAEGPLRHDLGRDAGIGRGGDAGRISAARSRSSGSPRRTR